MLRMKRIAPCMVIAALILGMTVIPAMAATAGSFTKVGYKNEVLAFDGEEFTTHFTPSADERVDAIVVSSLPDTKTEGALTVGSTALTEGAKIMRSSLANLRFTPIKDFEGSVTFSYAVVSGTETTDTAVVTMDIRVKNPTAEDAYYEVNLGESLSKYLKGGDPEGQKITYVITKEPGLGRLTLIDETTGEFRYWAPTSADETGQTYFTYKVTSGTRESTEGTVTILIEPAPVAYADLVAHWASYSAGMLASYDKIVGEQSRGQYFFYPNRGMTRGEFILFINAALDIEPESASTSAFDDFVPTWLRGAANAAYAKGIVSGVLENGKRNLRYSDSISRIEAIKMLDNALKITTPGTENLNFSDMNQVPDWAITALRNMVSYKIIAGSSGVIRPNEMITRAEGAEMVYKTFKHYQKMTQEQGLARLGFTAGK